MDDKIVRVELSSLEDFNKYVSLIEDMFYLKVLMYYDEPRIYFEVQLSNQRIIKFDVLHHNKHWNRTAYNFIHELYLHTLFKMMLPVQPRDYEPTSKPSKLPSLRSLKDGTA